MMRWIHHDTDGRRAEGQDAPREIPPGLLSIVGIGTATTIHDGVVYVDGRPAPPGLRRFSFRDGTLPVAVKAGGKAEFRPVEPRGGV